LPTLFFTLLLKLSSEFIVATLELTIKILFMFFKDMKGGGLDGSKEPAA
jgi:hypothetical protein